MVVANVRRWAGSLLREWAKVVWPEGQAEPLEQQAERLKQRIRQGYNELLQQRRLIASLQQQVEEHEQRVAALPWQVATYLQVGNRSGAWGAALELEQLRSLLEHERTRLRVGRQAYERKAVQLVEDRQRLGQLQRQILRLQAGTPATPGERSVPC